ncbi:MAG: hypothetical protein WCL00_07955 [Bacteroidota bacterium]
MKPVKILFSLAILATTFFLLSCSSNITMTGWKNPADNTKLSKILVMPYFEKLEFSKPFEQSMCSYFNSKGLKSMGSLELLNPNIKYSIESIKRKCDSLGIDAILYFSYQGTDKSQEYVPPTTYVSGGYGYGGYWGGGYWGGGYYGTTYASTGGYWMTTKVVNLHATLFTRTSQKEGMWTAEIAITDPQYVDQSAYSLAQYIYSEWNKDGMIAQKTK